MQTAVSRSETPSGKIEPAVDSNFVYPWQPDCGDGTYRNPVLYTDYSDPDVVRVGDDFYLIASSFNCTPGLPILHSKDLVNWTLIGHALENLPDASYDKVRAGCGVWAPSIRFHAGKYWIFYPTPDEGIFVVTATNPAGPWSKPHCVQAGRGLIDPCPLWDEDGKAYLVHAYAGSRAGIKHRLRVCPMAADGSKLLGEGQIVFHQPEKHPTIEGPKFLKKDGWYYILAPAGGVETGWQVVLRSKNIYGPYEDKIVLSQGDTDINGPHQGALVDAVDGGWWFLHFQDAGIYGRIVHLQPVEWRDGWPMMGRNGEPVRRHKKPVNVRGLKPFVPQTNDEFDSPELALQWQWYANHHDHWYSLAARPGWLRLYSQPATGALREQPNLLLQKFPARSFTMEIGFEFQPGQSGEAAGLIVVGEKSAAFGVRREGAENWLVLHRDDGVQKIHPITASMTRLRATVGDGGRVTFSFGEDGRYIAIPQTFQATKGQWIGAKIGLFCHGLDGAGPIGHCDFDYVRFS
jgi:beta-xylosidase